MKRWISGLFSLLVVLVSLQSAHAQTETVITQCDYQHVSKAVAVGGSIVLDCDRVIQIWRDKPLTIVADTSIKPAKGRTVTFEALKGRVFVVNTGISLTLENMTIQGNPNAIGGGIENNGGSLRVINVVFSDNDTTTGAAIRNHSGGKATIMESVFTANSTSGSGGAIYNDAKGEMTISDTSFTNNKSWNQGNGGAIYNLGTMNISGSTFSGNTAEGIYSWGGAIHNAHDAILKVSNSTFADNSAHMNGGAIRNDTRAETTIEFSTFIENSTDRLGGALYVDAGYLNVFNSLFFHNRANQLESDCTNPYTHGLIRAHNNLSSAGCGDKAATGVATLGDNGGLTQTVAIASDSNAVDSASECPADAIDQRGTARPQGKACDIGAYEFVELSTAATAVTICQVTTTRDVRLRQEPNTAGKVLAVVTHGLTFQAIEQVTGWYHITYGAVDGWISADFVMTKGTCGS